MKQPKVIFLDAVGTLFGVKGSVGAVYAEIAERFGVAAASKDLNKAFFQSFKASPPPIFPNSKTGEIPKYEFEWWHSIALHSFQQVGVLEQFSDFSAFFTELYAHFATAQPWFIYSEVLTALQYWQQLGIELGVLSNFDSRLYSVLQALELSHFFTSVTISTEVGAAKPNSQIFATGLEKHNCPPELSWHIGDSFEEDYQGAKAVGLRAIWLQRSE